MSLKDKNFSEQRLSLAVVRGHARAQWVEVDLPSAVTQFSELAALVEDAKCNDALSGGHSLEGSPVEGHSSVEGRRRQSAVQAKEITGGEPQVKRGADQGEDMEEEDMQDLISRVHMKLGMQLESRMRDVDAATCCTVFSFKKHYNRAKNAKGRPAVHRRSGEAWKKPRQRKSELC